MFIAIVLSSDPVSFQGPRRLLGLHVAQVVDVPQLYVQCEAIRWEQF